MRTGREKGGRASGIGRPLIGSAAGHLALLASLLLFGASAGSGLPGIVHVFLVEGTVETISVGETPAPADDEGARPEPADLRPRASKGAPHPLGDVDLRASPPAVNGQGAFPVDPPAQSSALVARLGTVSPGPPSVASYGGALEGVPPLAGISGGGPAGDAENFAALLRADTPAGGGGGRKGAEILRLRERIESRIVYPEEAVRRGQEGEVLLRIRVGEGGVPQEIRVARSSGTRTLDEAARNGVVRAAPLPSLPGWFEVPIRFSLR